MRKRNLGLTLSAMLGLLLAGCGSTALQRPPDAAVLAAISSPAFHNAQLTATQFTPGWWATFGDTRLQALIERAFLANHDVRLAAERVRQARAGQTAAASRLMPTLSATGSASNQQTGLPDEIKRGLPDTRAWRGALDMAWEVDLFGSARAGATAAELDAQAAGFGVEAARLLTSSEVARQYFLWQSARLRFALLEQLLQTQRDTERLIRSRESAGQASQFDVARAASEVQAMAAQLPRLHTLAAVSEHHLASLLGVSATSGLDLLEVSAPAQLPVVPALPTGQPAQLLLRRPDLRASERKLAATGARLAEARADLWPKFFLSALFGSQDLTLNGLDLAPARYSQVAVAFTLPIFNAGRLRANVEIQSSLERAALLHYERAVLNAVEDVESALSALTHERQRWLALDADTELQRTALSHAQSLFREGQIDRLQLLGVQRGVLAAELSAVDSRTELALNAVQLFKAMGGGWSVPATAPPRTSLLTYTNPIASNP